MSEYRSQCVLSDSKGQNSMNSMESTGKTALPLLMVDYEKGLKSALCDRQRGVGIPLPGLNGISLHNITYLTHVVSALFLMIYKGLFLMIFHPVQKYPLTGYTVPKRAIIGATMVNNSLFNGLNGMDEKYQLRRTIC